MSDLFDSEVERSSFRVKVAVLLVWVQVLGSEMSSVVPIVQVHLLPSVLPNSELLMLTLHDLESSWFEFTEALEPAKTIGQFAFLFR